MFSTRILLQLPTMMAWVEKLEEKADMLPAHIGSHHQHQLLDIHSRLYSLRPSLRWLGVFIIWSLSYTSED